MTATGWRTLCLIFATASIVQLWRDCVRDDDRPSAADCRPANSKHAKAWTSAVSDSGQRDDRGPRQGAEPSERAAPPTGDGWNIAGFTVPGWALWLAPHPGEDLRSYRDRMLPLAQAAIAPQRARVARSREAFAQLAGLDSRQRAELDGAAQDTAAALEDRVMTAVLGGELSPGTFKPMTGVSVARDLLDIVGRGNQRFLTALREDQRARLAQHPFDFGDYLVFSTPWEDALKFLD